MIASIRLDTIFSFHAQGCYRIVTLIWHSFPMIGINVMNYQTKAPELMLRK